MLEKFLSKISTPIREETLPGGRGIWNRDVFPEITLFLNDQIPIKVSGIAYDLVENDNLAPVIERQIARDRQISSFRFDDKTRNALKRFAREYRQIRENGMDGLFRAALKDGVAFNFYAKGIGSSVGDNPVASWIHHRNEIAFRIMNYQPGYNIGKEHNTLAHELGHYIMDDRNNHFTHEFWDLVSSSDFGQFWMQFIQAQGFFYDQKHWGKVFQDMEKQTKKKPFGLSPDAQYIAKQVERVRDRYSPLFHGAELFCRVLGHAATYRTGVDSMADNHPHKAAIRVLTALAEAYANGNPDLYQKEIDIVSAYRIPADAYQKGMAFQSFRGQCVEKLNQPDVQKSVFEQGKLYTHLRLLYFPL
ncbi:MAG: hypothetical protein IJV07_06015, partial [Alphaproteobacteria bacterium]|nr:hypothetical protein [Alphaproteobacteria bacterium]